MNRQMDRLEDKKNRQTVNSICNQLGGQADIWISRLSYGLADGHNINRQMDRLIDRYKDGITKRQT